jgi:hypothetical protein
MGRDKLARNRVYGECFDTLRLAGMLDLASTRKRAAYHKAAADELFGGDLSGQFTDTMNLAQKDAVEAARRDFRALETAVNKALGGS